MSKDKIRTVRVATPEEPKTKKLVLNQAFFRGTSLRRKGKDSPSTFIDAEMTAMLNADIRKVMEWDAPTKGLSKGDFLGKLICASGIFEANGCPEIQFDLVQAAKFKYTRDFDNSGQPKRAIFFTFQMTGQGAETIEAIDQHFGTYGSAPGTLTISYTMKIGSQEKLPGMADDAQETFEGVAEESEDEGAEDEK